MRLFLVAALILAFTSTAVAESKEEACGRLVDVIKVSLDRIVAGESSNRVRVALEAHRRLNCPVNGLLAALNIPAVPEGEEDRSGVRKRDSDSHQ